MELFRSPVQLRGCGKRMWVWEYILLLNGTYTIFFLQTKYEKKTQTSVCKWSSFVEFLYAEWKKKYIPYFPSSSVRNYIQINEQKYNFVWFKNTHHPPSSRHSFDRIILYILVELRVAFPCSIYDDIWWHTITIGKMQFVTPFDAFKILVQIISLLSCSAQWKYYKSRNLHAQPN